MSWMAKLYKTYENLEQNEQEILWPISHVVKASHLEVVINTEGSFLSGRTSLLKGDDSTTLIPATESSSNRAGAKIAPHPLCEELSYCAGDLPKLKQGKYDAYISQLTDWEKSIYSHSKVTAILTYLKKKTLWKDLSAEVDFPIKYKSKSGQASSVPPEKAFIRWRVEEKGSANSKTWEDDSLIQSWSLFDKYINKKSDFCFVSGDEVRVAGNHPRFLRNAGDGAKLISSNDSSGYTYRGRFTESEQVVAVGFDVSQKAHNTLRCLIQRQGFRNGEQVYVSWAVSGQDIPEPTKDPWVMFSHNADYIAPKEDHSTDIGQSYAIKLNKLMAGYLSKGKLKPHDEIAIIGIDSATPGRMGIIYYRETIAEEFLATITKWHLDFAWPQRQKKEVTQTNKKAINHTIWPLCAPAPKKIIKAVYGENVTDSLKKNIIERLMPCITEGKPLPIDIVNYAVKRATNRIAYKRNESGLWEQNLGIACALYKGYCKRTNKLNERKDYDMALEERNRSRDYLYGRLLAVAENIESYALYKAGEKRTTTAERMMQRFADRPCSTWRNLELSLQPYMHRLQSSSGGFIKIRKDLLDEILSLFHDEDFTSEKNLSGEFLLGFHCQRLVLNAKKEAITLVEN